MAAAAPIRRRHVAMIALGGMLGAGFFVGSGSVVAAAGPASLLSVLATALLLMAVMDMLGDMVIADPCDGSFVAHVRHGLGAWGGFVAGWLYLFFWVVVIGSEAIAGAIMLHDVLPLPVGLLAPLLVLALAMLNGMSVRIFAELEFVLCAVKIASIVLFVILAVLYCLRAHPSPPGIAANFGSWARFAPHGYGVVAGALPTVMFTMMGAEMVLVAAAESGDGKFFARRLTRSVGLRMGGFYLLSAVPILAILPWREMAAGRSPFLQAMVVIGVPGATTIMTAIVFVAILSCLNSALYVTSRLLAELADHGDAPAILSRRVRRTIPVRAIAACAAAGCAVAALSLISPDRVFAFLLSASGSVILFVYVMVVMAHWTMWKTGNRVLAAAGGMGVRCAPFSHAVVIVALLGALAAMLGDDLQRPTLFASLGTLAACLGCYGIRRYRQARRPGHPPSPFPTAQGDRS